MNNVIIRPEKIIILSERKSLRRDIYNRILSQWAHMSISFRKSPPYWAHFFNFVNVRTSWRVRLNVGFVVYLVAPHRGHLNLVMNRQHRIPQGKNKMAKTMPSTVYSDIILDCWKETKKTVFRLEEIFNVQHEKKNYKKIEHKWSKEVCTFNVAWAKGSFETILTWHA